MIDRGEGGGDREGRRSRRERKRERGGGGKKRGGGRRKGEGGEGKGEYIRDKVGKDLSYKGMPTMTLLNMPLRSILTHSFRGFSPS